MLATNDVRFSWADEAEAAMRRFCVAPINAGERFTLRSLASSLIYRRAEMEASPDNLFRPRSSSSISSHIKTCALSVFADL